MQSALGLALPIQKIESPLLQLESYPIELLHVWSVLEVKVKVLVQVQVIAQYMRTKEQPSRCLQVP